MSSTSNVKMSQVEDTSWPQNFAILLPNDATSENWIDDVTVTLNLLITNPRNVMKCNNNWANLVFWGTQVIQPKYKRKGLD
jgi:hypothetical protein